MGRSVFLFVALLSLYPIDYVQGQTYKQLKSLLDELLSPSRYDKDARPVLNQTETTKVILSFNLVSIVTIDEVTQSFVFNGFLAFMWYDQMLMWNKSDYGGINMLFPDPKKVWKPRVVIINTLGDRDPFADTISPFFVYGSGLVMWGPGGIFNFNCDLDVTNFPFDRQHCILEIMPMNYETSQLDYYITINSTWRGLYSTNGEWKLNDFYITTAHRIMGDSVSISHIKVHFLVERRPAFFVLNVLMPVVLLSILNMLVFTIPPESGEKISYGITVVLAMSVFLSMVSGMLPRSSDKVPNVTIYLFILLVVSVLTVIDAITVVYLYNKETGDDKATDDNGRFTKAATRITLLNRIMSAFRKHDSKIQPELATSSLPQHQHTGIIGRGQNKPIRVTPVVDNGNGHHETREKVAKGEDEYDPFNNKPQHLQTANIHVCSTFLDRTAMVVCSLAWLSINMWFFFSSAA